MNKITKKIIKFRNSRGWKDSDSPENIAKAISIEAAELLANFQWNNQINDLDNIKDEVADILFLVLTLCHDLDFDVEKIIENKLIKISEKYPRKN